MTNDKSRSAETVLAGTAKLQRLFDEAIKRKLSTTLAIQVKVERGRVEFVRVSENEELRPDH